jgi:hypothetical protein
MFAGPGFLERGFGMLMNVATEHLEFRKAIPQLPKEIHFGCSGYTLVLGAARLRLDRDHRQDYCAKRWPRSTRPADVASPYSSADNMSATLKVRSFESR